MLHLMKVPATLVSSVASGQAEVIGSIIKSVGSGQVIGHLQPTSLASTALLGSGNPVLAATEIASTLAANFQLVQLKHMVESLQHIAMLGSAVSVVNLGVSLGGFALVLSKLKSLDAKIDRVAAQIGDIARALDTAFRARGYAALSRAEEAFALSSDRERKRFWREAESELDYLVQHSFQQLLGSGIEDLGNAAAGSRERLLLTAKLSSDESLNATQWLLNCAGARMEILLCLEEPRAAARLASQVQRWLDNMQATPLEIARSRLQGKMASPTLIAELAREANDVSAYLGQGRDAFSDKALVCDLIANLGVDSRRYVTDARNHPEPTLLFLDASGSFSG